jgi:hypothetical protein
LDHSICNHFSRKV